MLNSNFDDHFKDFDKRFEQTRKAAIWWLIISAVFGLGFVGFVILVIVKLMVHLE
jgi:hypothetical protein